jgi:hypothetical protein
MAVTDEATSPETSVNRLGKPRRRGHWHPTIWAAIITGLCALGAAAIGVHHFTLAPGASGPHKRPPPSVTITSPQKQGAYIGPHIIVTGTVAHLRPDQVVAVFIQPYEKSGTPTSTFWPALGPAALSPQGTWSCQITVGPTTGAIGREFAIWAVIVTSAEAYTNNHTEQ